MTSFFFEWCGCLDLSFVFKIFFPKQYFHRNVFALYVSSTGQIFEKQCISRLGRQTPCNQEPYFRFFWNELLFWTRPLFWGNMNTSVLTFGFGSFCLDALRSFILFLFTWFDAKWSILERDACWTVCFAASNERSYRLKNPTKTFSRHRDGKESQL